MKVKLIEVLNMIEDKILKDDERAIIDGNLYYFNQEDKKFYTTPSPKYQCKYRNIYTDQLDLECELIDRNIIEVDVEILKSTEEIEELDIQQDSDYNYYIKNKDGTKCYMTTHSKIMSDKINELVKEVNTINLDEPKSKNHIKL